MEHKNKNNWCRSNKSN